MTRKSGLPERRSFGRRAAGQQGWIWIHGCQPLPCLVENLSVAGALLNTPDASLMPVKFSLSIGQENYRVICEVKHRTPTQIGVRFGSQDQPSNSPPKPDRPRQHEKSDWTGGVRRS